MKTKTGTERGQVGMRSIKSFASKASTHGRVWQDESRASHRSYSAHFDPRADRLGPDAAHRPGGRCAGLAVSGRDSDPGTDAHVHPQDHRDGRRRDPVDALDQSAFAGLHDRVVWFDALMLLHALAR